MLLTTEEFRAVGVSRQKAGYLQDLASKALTIPTEEELHQLDDEAIIERLTQVRGIGRWTVEMLLIFRLGRADVLPVDDYGVRKGWAQAHRLKDLPAPRALQAEGEMFRPYRTVAAWYCWRAVDTVIPA